MINQKPGLSKGAYNPNITYRPSVGLSDRAYDRKRLKEIEGTTDPAMAPYERYLKGERKDVDYKYHERARDQIMRLNESLSSKEIAELTDFSQSTIARMIQRDFSVIAKVSAEQMFYQLKNVGQ